MTVKNKCLVTGAAGFIGSNLSYKLISDGIKTIGMDNLNEYYDPDLKRARIDRIQSHPSSDLFQFEVMDLRDKEDVMAIVEKTKPTVICHLAAQAGVRYSLEFPHSYVENNISATINVLEAARLNDVKDIILASTSSVYGLNTEMPFNEDLSIESTISTYSASKRACELLCHTYHHLYGIRVRILRFFTVYGPWGRPDMALFLFTKAMLNKDYIDIFNKGKMSRDFTYIDDIVDGFVSAISCKKDFEIINLGCGEPVQLMKFIEVLEKELNIEAKKNFLPMQPGDVSATWADISKAERLLNYKPKIGVDVGISNFVKWYKEYHKMC